MNLFIDLHSLARLLLPSSITNAAGRVQSMSGQGTELRPLQHKQAVDEGLLLAEVGIPFSFTSFLFLSSKCKKPATGASVLIGYVLITVLPYQSTPPFNSLFFLLIAILLSHKKP
jgi:hypothetical protein